MNHEFIDIVRAIASRRILFLPHAIRQMSNRERMITTIDIREVLMNGEIIEDYPNDIRGHSCLILGRDIISRTIHIVCSPKEEFLAIITAYLPDPTQWDDNFRIRK